VWKKRDRDAIGLPFAVAQRPTISERYALKFLADRLTPQKGSSTLMNRAPQWAFGDVEWASSARGFA
jgi:hypothetical protein